MTNDNPEQEARAAVTTAMSEHHAYHCTPTERLPSHAIKDCPAIMPALDRLCTVVKEPLEAQLGERDERIRKLEEAARAAYAHVIELQDAWIRGVLSEHDGLGGTRSNRNDDVLHLITHALGEGWMDYEQIAAVRARLRATLNKALMKCNPSPLGDEGCDADIALDALVAFERAEAALIGYGWCQIHDRRRGAEAELEKLVKATEA